MLIDRFIGAISITIAAMSTSKPRVLFVLTSHSEMGASGKPTGWYLVSCFTRQVWSKILTTNMQPEFALPYNALAKITKITVASPAGGVAPVDENSVDNWKKNEICAKFWETKSSLWRNTEKLSTFVGKSNDFAAIFYVGGHGREFYI